MGRPAVLFKNGVKPCSRCKESKKRDKFYHDPAMKSGYSSMCIQCRSVDKVAREARPEVMSDKQEMQWIYKYGITRADYNRFLDEQDGHCAICPARPEDTRNDVLHVDHDHQSKKVRGLLCFDCNVGLGKFKDNAELLGKAIAYLQDTH